MAHLARYSPRKGTLSERTMPDDVSEDEKWRRFRALEKLQMEVVDEIHSRYKDQTVPILFEGISKKRWMGRTPTNKLVFVSSEEDLLSARSGRYTSPGRVPGRCWATSPDTLYEALYAVRDLASHYCRLGHQLLPAA
jgi:hypothetical protein